MNIRNLPIGIMEIPVPRKNQASPTTIEAKLEAKFLGKMQIMLRIEKMIKNLANHSNIKFNGKIKLKAYEILFLKRKKKNCTREK